MVTDFQNTISTDSSTDSASFPFHGFLSHSVKSYDFHKMVEIVVSVSLTQLLIGISFSVPEFLEWHTVPVQCKALFKIIELHKA